MSYLDNQNIFSLISFPRSGQHLTERLIQVICEYFSREFKYCEYYNCCRSVPCKKNSNFLKNHDFTLKLELPENYKKIVLYRTLMIEQLESFFRAVEIEKKKLFIDKKKWIENKDGFTMIFDYENNKRLYDSLLRFIKGKESYYNGFIEKWVNTNNPNTLILPYSEIVCEPIRYVGRLITFMGIPHTDDDVINILNKFEKIEYKHTLSPVLYERIFNDLPNVEAIKNEATKNQTNSVDVKFKRHPLQTMKFM
jgi:hypothetical protein